MFLASGIRKANVHSGSLAGRKVRMSNIDDLKPIFEPKSIAVIGASRSHLKIGHETLLNTLVGGFKGKIYPVNPETTDIMGLRTYPSVVAIEDEIDLALIAVPAAFVAK